MRTPGRTTLAAAAVLSAASALALAVPATAAPYPGPSGTRDVHGDIEGPYLHLGGPAGLLGGPLTDETRTPDGRGAYNAFERGSIYWTPATGAHEVQGAIREAWAARDWENSFLGFPVTDEVTTSNGLGRYNIFEGGSIDWTPGTGAHEVHGAIRDAWAARDGENSFLGFPVTDETRTPDGRGAYNAFEGGSIYWTPTTGAHEVHGAIRDAWAAQGYENGRLGFPRSDEYPTIDARSRVQGAGSDFQGGCIVWDAQHGATVLSPLSACPAHGD